MSFPVIKVENLSKLYRLGEVGTGSLAHDVNRWWHRIRGKEDPYSMVGQVNDRTKKAGSDWVWALEDINFEVNQGDVLGIIGRNGAGKSTLLKILSRTTGPTKGSVKVKGRIASLLEVGTGFHPELTGRENIYLNGAILGMSTGEIRRCFDEIVAFAEVEQFLDTPVKRYSSGMYVRLAFAVAAHLEPEILIVDEVLAVGDAAFQKKCLGKMTQVSRDHGRTILFVSHNVAAIRALCSRAIMLDAGRKVLDGAVADAIPAYLDAGTDSATTCEWPAADAPSGGGFTFRRVSIVTSTGAPAGSVAHDEPLTLCMEYELTAPVPGIRIGFHIQNSEGIDICASNDFHAMEPDERLASRYVSRCRFPGHVLNEGRYQVRFDAQAPHYRVSVVTPFVLSFFVEDVERHGESRNLLPGVLRPRLAWDVSHSSHDS